MRLAVLIASHNRRETTVEGLRRLIPALEAIPPPLRPHYFLVEDGSTDGTGDAVRLEFPQVRVIQGSGALFWAGGMALAYAEVQRQPKPFDVYLLFNDDVRVDAGAVSSCVATFDELNRTHPSVLVGACTSAETGAYTYGGWMRTSRIKVLGFNQVFGEGGRREVDTFNGNFVLIPARVFESLGGLDGEYRHAYADLDFGLRAQRQGARIFVNEVPVGTCERGTTLADRASRMDVHSAWRTLITGPSGLTPFVRFACRHGVPGLVPIYFCHELSTRLRILLASRPQIRAIGRAVGGRLSPHSVHR
ncbi:glycosyltransferase [Sporichthya sp.]|uniref:glycosyltransferase family 2 protein n=1 Tax=Sporichthya sp. TaxID=65475 RepID=UPI0018402D09|nr:glycosyltransferase [Sporichthya sp.]MBA3741944.1 glycosyltransferase family 2 protein [Sporichthya sp.]